MGFIVKLLLTLIWYITLMLLSAHMRVQAVCACARMCLSQQVFFWLLHTFEYIYSKRVYNMCVRVCVVAALFLLLPHQNSLGGDRQTHEIFNCRVFKRTTDALFC